jgi:hypothetical protein
MCLSVANWRLLNEELDVIACDNHVCEFFYNFTEMTLLICLKNFVPWGPIKADFWRVCILFQYGGYYADVDIEPLVPLTEFCQNCNLITALNHEKSALNPHFIFVLKNDSIMERCIDKYLKMFRSGESMEVIAPNFKIIGRSFLFSEFSPVRAIKRRIKCRRLGNRIP